MPRIHRIVPVLQLHTGRIELVCLACAVRVRPAGTDSHRYRLWRHEPREVIT